MNTFIILALASVAIAFPVEEPAPFQLTQNSDVDGSYSYTFSSEDASKTESRSLSGQVRGAYSYIDSEGVLQKIQYVADENGFQVYGTNLPVGSTVPVQQTPEVLEATAEHFALVDKHLRKLVIAEKLEAEYKRAHPELFVQQHHEVGPVVREFVAPARVQYIHQVEDEIPVAPEEDDDVKVARAEHLAEVARITNEHYIAYADALKYAQP